MQFTSTSVESLMISQYDKIIPFKVKMNLDILNFEGNIDVKFVDNCVEQLESCNFVNELYKEKNTTITSLEMSNFMHFW